MRLGAALLCAMLLAGCGGSGGGTGSGLGPSRTVEVDSSLPLSGPQAAAGSAIRSGIELALDLAHHRAGQWIVRYRSLDDAAPAGATPTAQTAQVVLAAREAATDPATVLAIGDLGSGASAVSAPILNEAGIPQISPGSSDVGLTGPGRSVYDPTGERTFLRLDSSGAAVASAELSKLRMVGCTRLIVLGRDTVSDLLADQAQTAGILVLHASAILSAEGAVRHDAPACVALGASPSPATTDLTETIHYILPTARIMGDPALCGPAWTDADDGGVQAAVDRSLLCAQPSLPVLDDPGGRAFLNAYEGADHRAPAPDAAIGYAAMELGLDAIRSAAGRGDDRSAIRAELFAGHPRSTVLGPIAFDRDGNATPATVGIDRVADGKPVLLTRLSLSGLAGDSEP